MILSLAVALVACTGGNGQKQSSETADLFQEVIKTAEAQIGYQVKVIEESGKILNARTTRNGHVHYIGKQDWTSGFFPGTMFYMYDLTNDPKWLEVGIKYTKP